MLKNRYNVRHTCTFIIENTLEWATAFLHVIANHCCSQSLVRTWSDLMLDYQKKLLCWPLYCDHLQKQANEIMNLLTLRRLRNWCLLIECLKITQHQLFAIFILT